MPESEGIRLATPWLDYADEYSETYVEVNHSIAEGAKGADWPRPGSITSMNRARPMWRRTIRSRREGRFRKLPHCLVELASPLLHS